MFRKNRPTFHPITVLIFFICSLMVNSPGTSSASGNKAVPHNQTCLFINGRWFNGESFDLKTMYSVNGILRETFSGEIDSTVDLQNKFIIPPFADAHNHLFADGMDYEKQIETHLAQGIFYVKNPNNIQKLTEPIRQYLNKPNSVDVIFANGGLTASGGHPIQIYDMIAQHGGIPGWTASDMAGQAYFVVDSEKDLQEKWPQIMAGKPDFIKTYLEYSEEFDKRKDDPNFYGKKALDPKLLPKIVALAHRHGLRVSTHVNTAADFRNAVLAGVDEINHLPLAKISEGDALLAARNGITVVTTTLSHRPSDHVSHLEEIHKHNLKLLYKAGVKLAIGTDNGDLTALNEVENLHRLGVFDNLTLLKIWVESTPTTIYPKRRIGHLQDGYEASFLALEGDPLENFDNIRKIALRCKQGHFLEMEESHEESNKKSSIAEALIHTIMMDGVEAALQQYHQLKKKQPDKYNFAESELNQLGYQLLNHNKTQDAVAILELNAEIFPKSANVYDSLADGYKAVGENEKAIACYEKVLAMLPGSAQYSEEFKKQLEINAQEGLASLKSKK